MRVSSGCISSAKEGLPLSLPIYRSRSLKILGSFLSSEITMAPDSSYLT
jgi:hypothetical protein